MGLTIHYKLFVAENLSSAEVRELANRTALYARKIGCAEVSEVMPVETDTPGTSWYVHLKHAGEDSFCAIPAERGWVVNVWPGEGCESTLFGLCQYPRSTPHRASPIATGAGSGWLLRGHCKTQYANEHGWDHFFRCHRMIVSILDFWRHLGATVEVSDEGEYWETRSEAKLRAMLGHYDGLVAAVAGALKDAAGETGEGHSVDSPIFARDDFEKLEAEGWREFGQQLSQLRKIKLDK